MSQNKNTPPATDVELAMKKAAEALRPLADAVFNDNGDMTVSIPLLSSEDCIQGYFASKRISAALTSEPAGYLGTVGDAIGKVPPSQGVRGWTKVPEEPPLDFLKSINRDNQVLAYENGRYYNAWFEFEASEGGWFWTDDADSEPNPSHYRALGPIAIAASEDSTE
jgi:hypothetical protein